jgi:hypothetical protein
MTARHTPSILQNLQGTLDNYLVLSSIIFNKASVSKLYDVQGYNQGKLTWFGCDKHF